MMQNQKKSLLSVQNLKPVQQKLGNLDAEGIYTNDVAFLKDKVHRIIGARLKAARINACFSEQKACAMFGYTNVAQLYQLESGERSVTNWIIFRACEVYSVSSDYIYGLVSEPDLNPILAQRMTVRHNIHSMIKDLSDILGDSAYVFENTLVPIRYEDIKTTIKATVDQLAKIRRDNAIFDEDIKGGSKLLCLLHKVKDDFDLLCREAERRQEFCDNHKTIFKKIIKDGGGDD